MIEYLYLGFEIDLSFSLFENLNSDAIIEKGNEIIRTLRKKTRTLDRLSDDRIFDRIFLSLPDSPYFWGLSAEYHGLELQIPHFFALNRKGVKIISDFFYFSLLTFLQQLSKYTKIQPYNLMLPHVFPNKLNEGLYIENSMESFLNMADSWEEFSEKDYNSPSFSRGTGWQINISYEEKNVSPETSELFRESLKRIIPILSYFHFQTPFENHRSPRMIFIDKINFNRELANQDKDLPLFIDSLKNDIRSARGQKKISFLGMDFPTHIGKLKSFLSSLFAFYNSFNKNPKSWKGFASFPIYAYIKNLNEVNVITDIRRASDYYSSYKKKINFGNVSNKTMDFIEFLINSKNEDLFPFIDLFLPKNNSKILSPNTIRKEYKILNKQDYLKNYLFIHWLKKNKNVLKKMEDFSALQSKYLYPQSLLYLCDLFNKKQHKKYNCDWEFTEVKDNPSGKKYLQIPNTLLKKRNYKQTEKKYLNNLLQILLSEKNFIFPPEQTEYLWKLLISRLLYSSEKKLEMCDKDVNGDIVRGISPKDADFKNLFLLLLFIRKIYNATELEAPFQYNFILPLSFKEEVARFRELLKEKKPIRELLAYFNLLDLQIERIVIDKNFRVSKRDRKEYNVKLSDELYAQMNVYEKTNNNLLSYSSIIDISYAYQRLSRKYTGHSKDFKHTLSYKFNITKEVFIDSLNRLGRYYFCKDKIKF